MMVWMKSFLTYPKSLRANATAQKLGIPLLITCHNKCQCHCQRLWLNSGRKHRPVYKRYMEAISRVNPKLSVKGGYHYTCLFAEKKGTESQGNTYIKCVYKGQKVIRKCQCIRCESSQLALIGLTNNATLQTWNINQYFIKR